MDYSSIQSGDLEESQNNNNSAMSIPQCSEDTAGCCGLLRRKNGEKRPLLERLQATTRTDYESLDYDCTYSKAYKEEKLDTPPTRWNGLKLSIMQWSLTFFIGFFTALVAFFIDYCTSRLTLWKFNTVSHHIDKSNGTSSTKIVEGLFMMCGFNLFFVTLAAIAVWIEPIAAGSGIPEIKCYLNGIKIPRVTRLKTLFCKAGGVLFSVSGGLLVGKEGPMIHSGAVIGAGLPQFRSYAIKFLDFGVKIFRRDRDKRDFVSGGAAAGVAAAFGAPIGGVLFSLEEGSSFWNQSLTWRTFFCAMAATFSLNFFMSGLKGFGWGTFYQPGLVNFGTFQCPKEAKECHLWSANDLLVFILMAIVGGLLGALFNHINMVITIVRLRYVQSRHMLFQVCEVMLVGLVTTVVGFLSAMALGQCREIDPESNVTNTRKYFCNEGQYNDMATLFFNSQEVAIKQLFHQDGTFSIQTLGIFFAFFFLLACWTYGIGVPSGLFVPSLLCGAAYGRLVAKILVDYAGYDIVYSGTFALIGSAAFLGGVVRMTISLTVILIESTNEITYGLPIMIVLMIAKWVGDLFNEGIYDLHIELKGIPFLGWDHAPGMDTLTAKDVMKTELSYIYPYTRALSVYDLLKNSKHNAFPVVTWKKKQKDLERKSKSLSFNERFRKDSTITRMGEQTKRLDFLIKRRGVQRNIMSTPCPTRTAPMEQSDSFTQSDPYTVPSTPSIDQNENFRPLRFHGMMLRSHLTVLMHQKIFTTDSALASDAVRQLTQDQLVEDYPRFHDVDQMARDDFANWMIVDVTRYMNPSPYTVGPETPLPKVFHLFRSMGLRHLPVVNCEGEILGVITRHNLTVEALEEAKEETTHEQTENSSTVGRRSTRAKLFRKSFLNNSLPI